MISTVEGSPDGLRSANGRPVTSFSYVYDCGSERSGAFHSELSLYRAVSDGKTDVLFVSHLHADHINGIDRLKAMAPAKTVILPYLDVVERLLFILSDFKRGAASRSSLEYFENAVAWWLGRGAERVIFLQPGRPDDIPPPRGAEPDGPIDDPTAGRRIRVDDAASKGLSANRLATYMRAPHGPISEKLTHADPTARETQSGAFVAASGSYLQLEWQAFTGDAWHRGDWILLPYVHPVDDPARKRFLRDIKKAIGFRGNDEAKFSKSLLEQLRSVHSTKQLVEIYNRHFAGGHNAISMSLYSGPLSRRSVASLSLTEPSRRWRSSREEPPYARFFWSDGGVGWLGTGAAALRQINGDSHGGHFSKALMIGLRS